jgi:two-component system alkaline phosphatase synthesis response regulator PhoP
MYLLMVQSLYTTLVIHHVQPPARANSMQSATILVVEDDQHILDVLVTCLRADGFRVHTANNGLAAVEQARIARPALVILDSMLPRIDGLEVCRRIQQERDVYVFIIMHDNRRADTRSVSC